MTHETARLRALLIDAKDQLYRLGLTRHDDLIIRIHAGLDATRPDPLMRKVLRHGQPGGDGSSTLPEPDPFKHQPRFTLVALGCECGAAKRVEEAQDPQAPEPSPLEHRGGCAYLLGTYQTAEGFLPYPCDCGATERLAEARSLAEDNAGERGGEQS